jgi:hypothetical protein
MKQGKEKRNKGVKLKGRKKARRKREEKAGKL